MAQPLVVHLLFHPASDEARRIATMLHHALNDDPAVPGLRIPTRLVPQHDSLLPPATMDLDDADHAIVIVIADDKLAIRPPSVPPGRSTWPTFVADLAEKCRTGRHHFLPLQRSIGGYPLDRRLKDLNFVRAIDMSDADVVRRVVSDLCRFMMNTQGNDQRVELRLFVSHAKRDIALDSPFDKVMKHLGTTQPIKAWVDSAEIEGGSKFADAIRDGVKNSALLVLATRHYSSRPWCRREILLAKDNGRPIVVVDCLDTFDVRSFPYLGNVPTVAWEDGGAQRAVDLLLKEQLRRSHVERLLQAQQRAGDLVMTAAPELITVLGRPAGAPVLYPDPPLGDEELEQLRKTGAELTTPFERASRERSLDRRMIALSISESDDPARYGVLPAPPGALGGHLDHALLDVSRYLLVKGATLAYGGHLGAAGYTEVLFDLVFTYDDASTIEAVERVVVYQGWPVPRPESVIAKYQLVATFIPVDRPDGVEDLDPATFTAAPAFSPSSPERRYAWARGMTAMRTRQTADIVARVVMGGKNGPTETAQPDGGKKFAWYSSRIPGVVEDGLLTMQADKPVYLCGGFGGAAALLADVIEGIPRHDFTWEFHKQAPHAEGMRAIYEQRGEAWWDYPEMTAYLRDLGVAGLARRNGLSEDQNRELFRTRDTTRVIELVLEGLTNVAKPAAG